MKKLFDIPVYALAPKTWEQRVGAKIKTIEKNAPDAERDVLERLTERETFLCGIGNITMLLGMFNFV